MAIIGSAIGGWLTNIIISLALTAASAAYSKHRAPGTPRDVPSGKKIKSNTRGVDEDIKIVYGKFRIGGNNVFAETSDTFHNKLNYAHSLCEGPIGGIEDDENGNPLIWFGGERIYEKYAGNNVWGLPRYTFEEHTGTSTQTANTIIDNLTDPMRHTAYVAWVLNYDEDLFRGVPQIQYLIKGLLLYDFRDETTAWSDNPALALYDYLTNKRYGVGLDTSLIDLDSFELAADYCDDKEFTINLIIYGSNNVWNNITDIMNLFRGDLNYWDGKYYLNFKDLTEETSVLTINDEHICQDNEGKAMISIADPGYYDLPTGVKVHFINANNHLYVNDSFSIGEESGLMIEFNAIGCTNKQKAGVLGIYHLERARLARSIPGRFRDDCISLEPGDVITLNTTALSIADQAMRVVSSSYTKEGFIDLSLIYESENLYNDVYDSDEDAVYSTTLPDPSIAPYISNAAVLEETYEFRMRTFSKLNITFDIPESSWFKHCEVYVSSNRPAEYGDLFINAEYTIGDIENRYMFGLSTNIDISTTQQAYGYYSIAFDGTWDWFTVYDHGELDFLFNDFTIDWFEYRTSGTAGKIPLQKMTPTGEIAWECGKASGTHNYFNASSDGSTMDIISNLDMGTFDLNTWNHFAVTRKGDTWRTFKNGVKISTIIATGTIFTADGCDINAGGIYGDRYQGYLDNIRIVKDKALWTDDFDYTDIEDLYYYNKKLEHQMIVKDDFTIDPVEEGQEYVILLRAVNIWGTKQSMNNATKLSIVVIGESSTPPPSLTYLDAVTGDGSVSLRSTKINHPDIEIYEFRIGSQWSGGILLSAKRSPHEELSLVSPGYHTFWCNTKGTNGMYGLTPQSASVTVPLASGWTLYTTFSEDYTTTADGQVFTNTEHVTYSSDDYLKCSHTSGVLSGTYMSREFDTGVTADSYYCYIDTEFTTIGGGSTWGDLFPSGAGSWEEINADTRNWLDIFEIEEAAQMTIQIYYKAETGHAWSVIENAQINAGVVTARYFKVEISIIDPDINVYAYVKAFDLNLYTS